MDRARFEFLKKIAAYFRENPDAKSYSGVSRPTCFSLLAIHFSSPGEVLDPTAQEFPAQIDKKINLFEQNLEQNQPPPQTLILPKELDETTKKWQEGTSRPQPPEQIRRAEDFWERKLKDQSLRAWQKINPALKSKISGFVGKKRALAKVVGALGKIIGIAGKLTGPVGIAITTLLSPSLLKKILKLVGAALLGLYLLLSMLGTGALIGAAIGAAIGGVIGGPVGAAIGAAAGGAVGYVIEHSIWRPIEGAWTQTGSLLGGVGNFLGGLWSGFWTGAGNLASSALVGTGNLASGALSWAGGAATATGNFAAGFISSLSGISLAPAAGIPVMGAIGVAAGGTLFISAFVVGAGRWRPNIPYQYTGTPTPYGSCSLAGSNESPALKELFINAAQWAGIPPAVLAAVASIEGKHMFGYSSDQIIAYSLPGAKDPINCAPNGCGARGPMQFLNDSVASNCGDYTGDVMPDVWSGWKDAVNRALPSDPRTPEICNIKDAVYAAAAKIKADSGTNDQQTCIWDEAAVRNAALAYYGSCSQSFSFLGNKTYCQYVWDYYQARNLNPPTAPTPSNWFYWQGDPSWSSYGAGLSCSPPASLGSHGCGPTSMAMVFTKFGQAMLPPQMWDEFVNRGSLICAGTTNYDRVFIDLPKQRGFADARFLGLNWAAVDSFTANGYLVVANTTQFGGHFIVIRSTDGNNVTVNDPAYSNGDGMIFSKLSPIWKNFWAIIK